MRQVKKNVTITLNEVIEADLEGFLDLLSEAVGEPLLMDIGYRVVGHGEPSWIVIEVTGEVEEEAEGDAEDV